MFVVQNSRSNPNINFHDKELLAMGSATERTQISLFESFAALRWVTPRTNFSKMQKEKVNAPINADSIVREIIRWDDPQNMRESLKDMLLAFFYYHDCVGDEWKNQIVGTYQTLDEALKNMNQLNSRNFKNVVR